MKEDGDGIKSIEELMSKIKRVNHTDREYQKFGFEVDLIRTKHMVDAIDRFNKSIEVSNKNSEELKTVLARFNIVVGVATIFGVILKLIDWIGGKT